MRLLLIFGVLLCVDLCRMSEQTHVIVVGGGLAGLSAAIEAAEAGAKVTLIEGEKNLGGNSAKASSGMNGVGTKAQQMLNIQDQPALFLKDTVTAGHNKNHPDLANLLVSTSADAVDWIIAKGVNLMDVNLCGGHSRPRTHWIPSPAEGKPSPVGLTIIRALGGHFDTLIASNPDRVKLMLGVKVNKIITEQKTVVGVNVVMPEGEQKEIRADAVILTTGGYSNDRENGGLLQEFAPDKTVFPTTNGPFALGSGVKMGREIGANLVNMDAVQIHPTGFIDPKDPKARTKFLAAEALRGKGAILVNQLGRRFANELGARDYLTGKIVSECSTLEDDTAHIAFMIMNEESVNKFGMPAFTFYWKIKKFFTEYSDLNSLSVDLGISRETLETTFGEYNKHVDSKTEDFFGKTVFPVKFKKEDKVSGGVHGDNRLAGNSLLECVVFGRIAGINAASSSKQPLDKNEL